MRPGLARLAAVASLLLATAAPAGVRGGEDEAIRRIFPEADRVEARDVILTEDLVARIEKLARARVNERLVTFYTARRAGAVAGYAVLHTHVVRTKPETLAIAFEPDGRIRSITVLSFLEPPEYLPGERWLAQFRGKGPEDRLLVGQDVAAITGATLTARGVAEESRWLLRALQVSVLEGER